MSALPTAVPIVPADSSAACSPRLGFPPVPAHVRITHKHSRERKESTCMQSSCSKVH